MQFIYMCESSRTFTYGVSGHTCDSQHPKSSVSTTFLARGILINIWKFGGTLESQKRFFIFYLSCVK